MSEHPYLVSAERVNEVDVAERPDDSMPQLFDRIRNGAEQAESKLEERVVEKARQLAIDAAGLEQAKAAVQFPEHAEALALARSQIMEKFERAVEKALAPVVTMLALHMVPALAQEPPSAQVRTSTESTVVVPAEARPLKMEDLFDMYSPLAIVGEKMKAHQRAMLPEELALLQELQQKVWQERNEWAMVSGKDKQGKFIFEKQELGLEGGRFYFGNEGLIESEKITTHTHPIQVFGISDQQLEKMKNGEMRVPMMPPSAGDIMQCIKEQSVDSVSMLNQVVDPGGVWEYYCDKKNPFAVSLQKSIKDIEMAIENILKQFKVKEEDLEGMRVSLRGLSLYDDSMQEQLGILFQALDKRYPGLEESGSTTLSEVMRKKDELLLSLLRYEDGAKILTATSLSEAQRGEHMARIAQNVASFGLSLSYMPFKKLPDTKTLRKE